MKKGIIFKLTWFYSVTFLLLIFVVPAFAYISVSTSASVIPEATPDENGAVSLNNDSPELVVDSATQALSAVVQSGTTNPTINLHALCQDNSATSPAITIRSANAYNLHLTIADSTFFTGNGLIWNCILSAPRTATINLPETAGATTILRKAIEVGHDDLNLSFDKPVRLLFPGDVGQKVGYTIGDDAFIEILSLCNGDSGVGLAEDEDCKVSVANDLVVWTRHFTKFATFSADPIVPPTLDGDNEAPVASSGGSSPVIIVPTLGTSPVTVSGGKIVTSRNITLFFNVINADTVMVSEKSTYADATWETYSISKSFTLSEAYGNKVVYLKFRSASGGEVGTQIVVNYVSQKTQAPSTATTTSTTTTTTNSTTTTLAPKSSAITVPDATHNLIITEPGIKLFDIILTINNAIISKSKDLVAKTEFTSFGTVPTEVKLIYKIKDSQGQEVFSENGETTVETEKLVTKEFKKLNLADGKYTLLLTTIYGNNVTDEFKQTFEINKNVATNNESANSIWFVFILIPIIFIGALYIFIKRKNKKTKLV